MTSTSSAPADTPRAQRVLDKATYDAIRAELSFRPNPWAVALIISWHMLLVSTCVYLLLQPSLACYWAAQLLIPIACFESFAILHDAGHGACVHSRLGNALIGHYASMFCFLPFYPWKYIHAEHHVWAGNVEKDPGLALVRRAKHTGRLPRVLTLSWRAWFPLGGLAQHVVYWSYPLKALRDGKLGRDRALRCVASAAWLMVVYAACLRMAPTLLVWRNFAPGLFAYLMLVELVNLPHHIGLTGYDRRLPLWQQHLPTRSCNYPPLLSELLVMNFNFHIEHHYFPTLPWYRLRRARRLLKPALGDDYREAHGIRWHIRNRARGLLHVLSGSP